LSSKLFCYVDETGQDTLGDLFIVAVIVVPSNREQVRLICEAIERQSGKHRLKWYESSQPVRIAYVRSLLSQLPDDVQLCFAHYQNSLDYLTLTVDAIANTINQSAKQGPERTADVKVTALVDGLPRSQERAVGSRLRRRGLRIDKVRGVKREENDVLLRLADALCGFVRQARTGGAEAQTMLNEAIELGRIKEISGV
jgi:hypothetical protein